MTNPFKDLDPLPTLNPLEISLHPQGPYRSMGSDDKRVIGGEVLYFPSNYGTLNGEFGMAYYRFLGGISSVTCERYDAGGLRHVSCELNNSMDQPWFNYEILKAVQPVLRASYGDRAYSCFAWYHGEQLWKPWRA